MPIIISVTPESKDDFKPISYFATGENGIGSLVKEMRPMLFDGKSYIFTYSIESINRAEKNEVGMTLNILFEGDKEPVLNVIPNGVKTRKFAWENSPEHKKIQRSSIYFIVVLFLCLFIFIIVVARPIILSITDSPDKGVYKKYAQSIFDSIKEESIYNNIDEQQIKENIAKIFYRQRKKEWDFSSFFSKWILGLREPQKEDYLL